MSAFGVKPTCGRKRILGFMSHALSQPPARDPSDFRKDGFELLRGRRTALRIGTDQHRPAGIWLGDRDVTGRVLAVVAGLVADLPVLGQAGTQAIFAGLAAHHPFREMFA